MEGGRSNLFREIHKNAWLKRILPATKVRASDNLWPGLWVAAIQSALRIHTQPFESVTPPLTFAPLQRGEKFWVVFCVHDDFEAFLEGYQEPRSAPSHQPDWTVSLQTTQHISHALFSLSDNDYEFVITLTSSVARFTAPSW